VTVEAVATDNIHPAGREWRARGQIKVATGQGQHAIWRWRGKARGQITVATVEGVGMTYSLEAGKEGKRLSHGCNCKEGRQHTNWRWRGRVIGQIMVGTVKREVGG
jgi:hypothetical protein